MSDLGMPVMIPINPAIAFIGTSSVATYSILRSLFFLAIDTARCCRTEDFPFDGHPLTKVSAPPSMSAN